ncbi:MAG: hypothetical protein ACI9BW_004378, partial [Gammaproteobacteria bacterium]
AKDAAKRTFNNRNYDSWSVRVDGPTSQQTNRIAKRIGMSSPRWAGRSSRFLWIRNVSSAPDRLQGIANQLSANYVSSGRSNASIDAAERMMIESHL